jgi:hypothetical protein
LVETLVRVATARQVLQLLRGVSFAPLMLEQHKPLTHTHLCQFGRAD